jgi:hypothetical protein
LILVHSSSCPPPRPASACDRWVPSHRC